MTNRLAAWFRGDLFVAIKGDKFDAHDFVTDVGARRWAVIVSREMPGPYGCAK